LLSGDGGWAGLDKNVAAALSAKGVDVVGVDSLRYFWSKRTPQGLADDLDRIVRYYAAQWKKSGALLVGYSQGADVLPFAINRLPAATQGLVRYSVLMGLSQEASFEFHVGNWLGSDDDDALPIKPEASKLDPRKTLCIYGEDEKDSLCPQLAPASVQALRMAGGHHFDGAYDELATTILEHADAELLGVAPDSPALYIQRIAYLAGGACVEFTKSWYRADAYDFVSELTLSPPARKTHR